MFSNEIFCKFTNDICFFFAYSSHMKFSIIIVTYNRHKELFNCLESITWAATTHPYEVIVIFNGDRTYMEKCSQLFKSCSLHFIHKTTPSSARNFGLNKARGEFLFFLDDDCTLPTDYFSKIDFMQNWDVLGGPDQTPQVSSPLQNIIGRTLSSPLCMGPTYKRHTTRGQYIKNASEKTLILCNLWMKRSLFSEEHFAFNPQLFRNEENFLLKELKNKKKVLHYSPSLFVYHQRKENLENLGASIIKSGECRFQNLALLPQKKEIFYLLPLIWLCLLVWIAFHPQSIITNGFIIYSTLVALYHAVTYKSLSLRFVLFHYFVLATYSIGLIKGLWKFYPLLYNNLRENKSFISESSIK
jgi:glycosyltransferase involved in cell wall biosynthesis